MNGSSIIDEFGNISGVLFIKFRLESLFSILQDSTGLGKSGELTLGAKDVTSERISFLSPLRNQDYTRPSTPWTTEESKTIPMQKAIMGENESGFDTDYSGQEILASWRNIPEVNWGLVAKKELDEIYIESNDLLWNFFVSSLIIALISSFISILFSKYLVSTIHNLKSTLDLVGQDALPDHVEIQSKDEVGLMANTV